MTAMLYSRRRLCGWAARRPRSPSPAVARGGALPGSSSRARRTPPGPAPRARRRRSGQDHPSGRGPAAVPAFGLRCARESLGDKLVVHNYGHGGAGVTLSWGRPYWPRTWCGKARGRGRRRSSAAARWGSPPRGPPGPRFRRDDLRRELPPETTSNVAGAMWYRRASSTLRGAHPRSMLSSSARRRSRTAGSRDSWEPTTRCAGGTSSVCRTAEIRRSRTSDFRALSEAPGTRGVRESVCRAARRPREHDLHRTSDLPARARPRLSPRGRPDRRARFRGRGRALALPQPVVMNCTGLGARELFGDRSSSRSRASSRSFCPSRSRLRHRERRLYMFPRSDGILLGGTFERGAESLEPDLEAEKRILERQRAIFDGMRSA